MPEQFQEGVSRLLCRTGIRPDAGESFPTIRRASHDWNKSCLSLYILIWLDRFVVESATARKHQTCCWTISRAAADLY
jgi:hypothetical protein